MVRDFNHHETFCRESLMIRNPTGSRVPLLLSPGQKKLDEAIERQQRAKKPVRLVVLKCRRTWFTTGVCAKMFKAVPFFPGRKGVVIADRYRPAALEAFDYLLQFQRGYIPFNRHGVSIELPKLVKDTEQQIAWENESAIDVFSADVGEIRGGGRHWALFDEVAFWRDAGKTLTGALNMVPKEPDTCVVVQSTANGQGGEFYDMWQQACDPANRGGFEALFFGWLDHPPYRIPLTEDPGKFQASLDREERYLQDRFGASVEQLNWRRVTIATECRGKVDLFHQEYPTTPEEAFLASGRPVFDQKMLSRMPVSTPTVGELELLDGPVRRLQFIVTGDNGALSIWRKPEAGHMYVIGADPSEGKDVSASKRGEDPDYSVGFVVDRATGVQVAMLRERIRPGPFADYLALLGRYYNWAYICPEANNAGFIDALVRTTYPLELIYQRQRDPTDRRPATIQELGFETTGTTRPWLIEAADDAIRNMEITILSQVAVRECQTFVIKPNQKKEGMDGCHDDTVLALALAAIGIRTAPRKQFEPVALKPIARRTFYGRKRLKDEDE